jgi:hypothetical protein
VVEQDIVEKVRAVLRLWDAGEISRGEFEHKVHELFYDPVSSFDPVSWLEKGETVMTFGSCCCASHPPDRTFKVEITIQPHGYTAKRCD